MLTESQIKERLTGIGGSDCAAVLGLSRYKTKVDIFLEKTGQKENEVLNNDAVYWGSVLEPIILKEYEKREKKECVLGNVNLFRSKKYPWLIANLDAYVKNEPTLVEIKTCSAFKKDEWGDEESDEIPREYLIQCAHYAIVMQDHFTVEKVDLIVLIGGQKYRKFTYLRNKELENEIIKKTEIFWNENIIKIIAPASSTEDEARLLYSFSEEKQIVATCDIEEKYDALLTIQKEIDSLSEKESLIKKDIMDFMKESDKLFNTQGNQIITWKTQNTKRFNTIEFKKQHPETYDSFCNEQNSRVFRITVKK